MRTAIRWSVKVLCGLLTVAVSHSAVIPAITFEEMTRKSVIILHARVVGHNTAWDSTRQFLWTHYSLSPIDPIKGKAEIRGQAQVVVSEPGGRKDGLEMRVEGAVSFQAGEEVVVFLYCTPSGLLRPYGYAQGKFVVREGKIRAIALEHHQGVGSGSDSGTAVQKFDGVRLQEFKSRIRAELRR
jgi:hypothetical protein